MSITGRCYCGDVHYKAEGPGFMKFECYCRECRYISGGGPVMGMAVLNEGFEITKGEVKGFTRADIDHAVTRQFCPNCGTRIEAARPTACPKCGTPANGAKFCPECGTKIG